MLDAHMKNDGAPRAIPDIVKIKPDKPAPKARVDALGDPLADITASLNIKRQHHLDKLAAVKQELLLQRDRAKQDIADYEKSRGRMVLLVAIGDIPREELSIAAKICQENRDVVGDIEEALPLLNQGGADPEIEAVTQALSRINTAWRVLSVLNDRCLELSISSENGMAASMHLRQKSNQVTSLASKVRAMVPEVKRVYGADKVLGELLESFAVQVESM